MSRALQMGVVASQGGGGGGTAPTITSPPTISGPNEVGGTLTVTPGAVTGSPAPTNAFQWRRGGVDIGGATGLTYDPVMADENTAIDVVQTATNASGSDSADSADTAAIIAPPEEIFSGQLEGLWRGGEWTTTGSNIDQMDDLSGNGRHMVQTGVNRPTTTTVGGHDAARFDPSSNPQYLATAGTHAQGSAPHALGAVYRNESAVAAGMTLVAEGTTHELRQASSRRPQFRNGSTSIDGATSITSLAAVLCVDDGVGATIYVDNVSDGSNGAATDGAITSVWSLGARPDSTFANDMTFVEGFVLSGAITSTQRAQYQRWAAASYGL